MWVFTENGFISAVRHFDYPDKVMIRARDKKSLEWSGQEVTRTPDGDYPYRVTVSDEDFKGWLCASVDMLDYYNFKSQVATIRGHEFARPLHEVWSVMHDVEDKEARTRKPAVKKTANAGTGKKSRRKH